MKIALGSTFSKAKFHIYHKGKIIMRIPEWLAWILSCVSPNLVCAQIETDYR